MLKTYLLSWVLLGAGPVCLGQRIMARPGEHLLYFRKNHHRETAYAVGEALGFTVRGEATPITGRIQGFEGDSVLLFNGYRFNVRTIDALLVDDKTKVWFIFRYKYEKLGLLAGGLFFPLNTLNTGRVQPQALAVSGALLGAGLLARLLISRKLKIRGQRRLLIISG